MELFNQYPGCRALADFAIPMPASSILLVAMPEFRHWMIIAAVAILVVGFAARQRRSRAKDRHWSAALDREEHAKIAPTLAVRPRFFENRANQNAPQSAPRPGMPGKFQPTKKQR